jgi:hypothetical protein
MVIDANLSVVIMAGSPKAFRFQADLVDVVASRGERTHQLC